MEAEEARVADMAKEAEGLREKHRGVLDYANQKLREVVGDHRMA